MSSRGVAPGALLFTALVVSICAGSELPGHHDLGESMREGDEAAAALQALKAREGMALKGIKVQRAGEVAKLKAQHAIEEAAERQQQQLEMKDLRQQQHEELERLKEKVGIKMRVEARVLGEKPGDVMKAPEVMSVIQRQKEEANTIKSQREAELHEMVATHTNEIKRQTAQGLRDITFAKRKYADSVAHQKEQLEFFRYQEKKARSQQGDGAMGDDLGEGVDSMSESTLRHKVLSLEAQNEKLTEKNKLLLDASAESRSSEEVQRLKKEKAAEDEEVETLKAKLKLGNKVWGHAKQQGPQMLDDGVSSAEAVLAVP